MSTLKVDGIRSNSASSDAITLANDGTCTANITNNLSNRNLVINGAMQVAQRGTSQSPASGYGTVDRFIVSNPTGSQTQAASQETDAPVGLYKSLKVTCTTANTNITTSVGDQAKIEYRIEGTDLANIHYGTANAQTLTVSFYVKSNKTGNTAIGLVNYSNNRCFVHQYNIASANTWQRVSFSVTGDTSGTWGTDTGIGMRMRWGSFGTNHQTTSFNAWQSGQFMATGNSPINFNSATNDYLQITGVQVERGSVATDFEHRSYAQELELCKRYFQIIKGDTGDYTGFSAYSESTTSLRIPVQLFPPMRAAFTVNKSGTFRFQGATNDSADSTEAFSLEGVNTTFNACTIRSTAYSSMGAADRPGNLQFRSDGASLKFDAEL
tara:strand:+ start:254 stop:1396 length:1143 start_codon:yes stop_codon:yes gene_type:complete